jgi:ribosomal protein S12 methylthiotransferase accessory factor
MTRELATTTEVAVAEGWMVAALASALAFVGPDHEIEVALDGDAASDASLAALWPTLDRGELATAMGAMAAEVEELVTSLLEAGALAPAPTKTPPAGVSGMPLADALLGALRGATLTVDTRVVVVTADEALVLPAASTREHERRTLHAFVGTITPDLRLRAYCRVVAEGVGMVRADRPPNTRLEDALERLGEDDGRVHVLDLLDGDDVAVDLDDLGRIGCERAHRLGPIANVAPLVRAPEPSAQTMHVYVARYGVANLRFPDAADARLGGGRSSDPELAELIARAEAAERYGCGDTGPHALVRAGEGELDAPFVAPDRIYRPNARQQRTGVGGPKSYDPSARYLWIRGETPAGEPRWLPADAVFYPYFDPVHGGRTLSTSSSGSAAHTTLAEARMRAMCELVERDAFMWTWVQRVARESIDSASLPGSAQDRVAHIERGGLEVSFVNLTLDLLPVIACVIHSSDRLSLALASSMDPAEAVERTLNEAVGLLEIIERGRLEPIEPEDVRNPEQHAALHLDPARIEQDRFLFGSEDTVALEEIAPRGASPDELVATLAEPIVVDLSSPATAPFAVARVVIPDIVPISFGYDREPLGMPRLAEPKRTHDGRILGRRLDLAETGPLDPHPFA